METTDRYNINVFFREEDSCYVADIRDQKYRSAFGDTPEEAVHEVMITKGAWLETAKEANTPIPSPLYRSAVNQVGA